MASAADTAKLATASLQRSFSQDGEDRLLLRSMRHKRNGFFIDIGAYHPFRFSNTALFYEFGWRGLNVDATPGVKEMFDEHRPGDTNVHCAVTNYTGTMAFKTFAEGAYNTALTQRAIPAAGEGTIVEVPCDTINNILAAHVPEGTVIDFISIDVEGLDTQVVSDLDLTRWSPQFIVVEDHGINLEMPDRSATYQTLVSRGYRLRFKQIFSCIYEKLGEADADPAIRTGQRVEVMMNALDDQVVAGGGSEVQARGRKQAGGPFRRTKRSPAGRMRRAAGGAVIGGVVIEPVSVDDVLAGGEADVLISSSHSFVQDTEFYDKIAALKQRLPQIATCVYMRDNHHMYSQNIKMAAAVDFVAPGHFYKQDYLRVANYNVLDAIPMASGQFLPNMAEDIFGSNVETARSDALYGGYGFYGRWPARSEFIDRLGREIEGSAVVQWRPEAGRSYYAMSKKEAFLDWMAHKVSVVVHTDFCIPQRVFDALATGQIPLVPKGLPGFGFVIPPEQQAALPIVFYDEMTVDSVRAAYEEALRRFDEGGLDGAARRHRYAIDNHFMHQRYALIVERILQLSATVF